MVNLRSCPVYCNLNVRGKNLIIDNGLRHGSPNGGGIREKKYVQMASGKVIRKVPM